MDLVDEMIGLCTLGAINFGNIRQPGDFERPAKILVRLLNAILDYQDYPVEAARRGVELYRNLGIGISNLAYFLAKHNFKYSSPDVLEWLQPFLETFSYYIIKASADLAEKDGACSGFQNTNYARGLLPALNYKKELDEVVPHQLLLDWESLKEKVMRTGLRNASLMACMPVESSSLPSNATNGIDPPRNLISIKASKDGAVKQVVPEISRLKNKYEFMFDHPSTKGYLGICGLISKFIDQSISTNTTYQPASFEGGEIPLSVLLSDLIYAYNLGVHTLYYNNVDDGSGEVDVKSVAPLAQDSAEESQENCEACVV